VIHRRLVVQLEAVVAQPPVVADALLLVDDQGIEAEPLQFDRRRDAGMTAADDQHIGFSVLVGEMLGALVEPTRLGEIARVRHRFVVAAARGADAVHVEQGRERPGLRMIARQQPDDAEPGAVRRAKAEDRFDHLVPGDGGAARR
jgi:hypothetical protein